MSVAGVSRRSGGRLSARGRGFPCLRTRMTKWAGAPRGRAMARAGSGSLISTHYPHVGQQFSSLGETFVDHAYHTRMLCVDRGRRDGIG